MLVFLTLEEVSDCFSESLSTEISFEAILLALSSSDGWISDGVSGIE